MSSLSCYQYTPILMLCQFVDLSSESLDRLLSQGTLVSAMLGLYVVDRVGQGPLGPFPP